MASVDTSAAATATRRGPYMIVAVIGVFIVLIVLVGFISYVSVKTTDTSTTTRKPAKASLVVSLDDGAGESKYNYELLYLPHLKGVIIDDGFPRGSSPEEKKEIVAKAAAHDPFVLWYFLTRIYDMDAPNMKQLEGKDLRISWHQKLLVLLEASDFTEVNLEGRTFFNEGHGSGGVVTAAKTTFVGDVPATEIKYPGKPKKLVKNNCVNKQGKTCPTGTRILKPRHERGKGADTTGGAARQPVSDSNAVRSTTPGYGGSGDSVADEQQSTASSTLHNSVGHAGTGAGGTTPLATNSSGEISTGGGQADTTYPGNVSIDASGDPGAPR